MTFETIQNVVSVVTAVIALASAIAALTPTPKDDNLLRKVRSFIDTLAINVKHARNK